MANHCVACRRFVTLSDIELVESEVTIDGAGVTINASLIRKCDQCGSDLLQLDLTIDEDIDHDCEGSLLSPEFTLNSEEIEETTSTPTEYLGKPILKKNQVTYYGINASLLFTCHHCFEQISQVFTATGTKDDFYAAQ